MDVDWNAVAKKLRTSTLEELQTLSYVSEAATESIVQVINETMRFKDNGDGTLEMLIDDTDIERFVFFLKSEYQRKKELLEG